MSKQRPHRTREHPGTSDKANIQCRRLLRQETETAVSAAPAAQSRRAASTSTSTVNSGRVKPPTIISVEAG